MAKEEQAVRDKDEEIAAIQAERVQLQAVADATSEEIKGIHEDRAELSQRLAKLNAVQEQQTPVSAVETIAATDCLTCALLGLQNYESQPAEIQALLVHFARRSSRFNLSSRLANARNVCGTGIQGGPCCPSAHPDPAACSTCPSTGLAYR